jgi:hypothetical protein
MMGDGVEGPARDPASSVSPSKRADTTYDLARRAAGERQEQDSLWCDAALEKDVDPGGERGRLPGSGSRDHSQRPVAKRGGLTLPVVEFSFRSEHPFEL